MDFTVLVTKWIKDKEKVWKTIGETKLIIYSWYRMNLNVSATEGGTIAELSITYKRPAGFFSNIVSFLLADPYYIWFLHKMLNDAAKALQTNSLNILSSTHS